MELGSARESESGRILEYEKHGAIEIGTLIAEPVGDVLRRGEGRRREDLQDRGAGRSTRLGEQ
jgi:hypothetical protein